MNDHCKKHNKQKYRNRWTKAWICDECLKEKNQAKLKKATKSRKSDKLRAMTLADQWFSRYIRLRDAKVYGDTTVAKCYTCGRIIHITKIQAGHFIRRGYKTTRFNPDNCKPQCVQCNYFQSGKPEIFEQNLIKEIGYEKTMEIKQSIIERTQDTIEFYKEQASTYKKLTNQLLKDKQISKWW